MAKYFLLLLLASCSFRGIQQEVETTYTVERYEQVYREDEYRVIIWMIDEYSKTQHTLTLPIKDTVYYPIGYRFKQLIKL